eukprot:gnl/TRDRNA2_/TRDRNA2_163435_c0_seq2.p1 gnl/TRDRNA2_/TRDRNA2_163435_c0~~gnl/TRDRNA2_/TRDRNA2_163435_c0_seq2.p1  ORF type:complete len:413 (+),score=38.14 gnl/TRDRNA2_/TRDRNA2_163435_c0_seq2:150-1388(+)
MAGSGRHIRPRSEAYCAPRQILQYLCTLTLIFMFGVVMLDERLRLGSLFDLPALKQALRFGAGVESQVHAGTPSPDQVQAFGVCGRENSVGAGLNHLKSGKKVPRRLHFLTAGHSGSSILTALLGDYGSGLFVFEPWGNAQAWWHPTAYKSRASKKIKDNYTYFKKRSLLCLFNCEACDEAMLLPSRRDEFARYCSPGANVLVVKTICLLNVAEMVELLPLETLCSHKFVLLLRDPRSWSLISEKKDGKRKIANWKNIKDCNYLLALALTIKYLAAAVGTENVRTSFFEHWSRNTTEYVSAIGAWAGINVSERGYKIAKQPSRSVRQAWGCQVEEYPSCADYMELVGYPRCAEIGVAATDLQDPPPMDYSRLVDPATKPLTESDMRLLAKLSKNLSWMQPDNPAPHGQGCMR